jgi:hypothetical protein
VKTWCVSEVASQIKSNGKIRWNLIPHALNKQVWKTNSLKLLEENKQKHLSLLCQNKKFLNQNAGNTKNNMLQN